MKSALELAMEKLRRLEAQTTPEEKEASRREYYMTQGETFARRHLEDPFFSLEKVDAEVQRLPVDRQPLAWQGFWRVVLTALQLGVPAERAESVIASRGGEAGQALLERYHHLQDLLHRQEDQAFAACVAYFEGQPRLQRLAAAGIRVDYATVARQSRYWQKQRDALRAAQTPVLDEAKASFWRTLFPSDYPSSGKNSR